MFKVNSSKITSKFQLIALATVMAIILKKPALYFETVNSDELNDNQTHDSNVEHSGCN